MTDERVGWAIEKENLLRTMDGGETWTNVTPNGLPIASASLFFLDQMTSWVVVDKETGFQIYRTFDGGSTWKSKNPTEVRGHFSRLFFLDKKNGWMMTQIEVGSFMEKVEMYHTMDGGETWNVIALIDSEGNKTGLSFQNLQAGWMGTALYVQNSPWLYTTKNRGVSWEKQVVKGKSANEPSLFTTEPPRFFAERDGVFAVHFECKAQQCTNFFTTQDGGKTWESTSILRYANPNNYLMYDFVEGKIGWATDGAKLYDTQNGAKDWHILFQTDERTRIVQLDFVNSSTGWVLLSDKPMTTRLVVTADGGYSWREIATRMKNQ